MCDLYEVKRGFILAPQSLHNQGQRLRLMIEDFDRLQKRFEGELEIFFSKNGGFIICFPIDMDAEELFDDTNYLAGYLDVTPHIIDLARAA